MTQGPRPMMRPPTIFSRIRRAVGAVVAPVLLVTANLAAQETLAVTGTASFATACRADRPIRLPIADSLRYPVLISSVTVDDKGRLYVVDSRGAGAFAFDSLGRPLFRVGSRGRGPGEFERITQVTRSRGGRFFVLDQVGMTVGVLDSTQREVARIRTRAIGGRRMILQDDSIPVLAGHYDLGRSDRQLAAFSTNGDLLWSSIDLPPLLRRLTPRLDLSVATALANGDIVTGSGIVPEIWLHSKGRTTRISLPLSTRWRQLEPLGNNIRNPSLVAEWLSRSTVAYEAVTIGDRLIAIGFGTDVAVIDLLARRLLILTDAPGVLSAGRPSGRLLLTSPPDGPENVLTWYTCKRP